jgi:acyl carrier protein
MWLSFNMASKAMRAFRTPVRLFGAQQPEVEAFLISHLKEIKGVHKNKVTPSCNFKEINLDSLSQMEMYSVIESKFDLTLSEEDTDGLKSVPDLVKTILAKLR